MNMTPLYINGHSSGGTNYMRRILEAHLKYGESVLVTVGQGQAQDAVYKRILKDIIVLNSATRYSFFIRVEKE